ncbi:hypothetical protein [Mycobacteroides abscessus]|uniref:hypothetical protein n=1 Tax=Mycobacteroides abscessus TaxID=36809 RepID=UPI0009A870D8|nr:hypothetical protein [Mycobacteroides abscessus]MBN7456684.1 hypothetical protein [Mycobacteroides abscessus subsp. abscessus]SKU95145.1 Uncharacterised protein [Mycobacteroides abscessus subsp. bolletii]SLC72850.1 Uncharacterised protein [Mycobacteroides abscessus subsp. massiliense]SLJ50787.1 Uncharacterised protein [Mycobacteroides abscessus subsp. abscessus]
MVETNDREQIARQFLDEIAELDKLRDAFRAADAQVEETKRGRDKAMEAYVSALGAIKKAGWGATPAGLAKMGHVMPSNLKRNRRNNTASPVTDEDDREADTQSSQAATDADNDSWDQR